ncbi:MAG TPA: DUF6412 domain-containing protein [Actinoplanes sp.]|jgi:hypothetical protein|nr:DUF6412 domain-containing protein [Actinoplanes sp.]
MLFWGLWVLVAMQSPAPSAHVALGLAVVAAALLAVLAAAGLPLRPAALAGRVSPVWASARTGRLPRLLDPDAAGRPRPRAPSAYPVAAW